MLNDYWKDKIDYLNQQIKSVDTCLKSIHNFPNLLDFTKNILLNQLE
jgi:hypothetical protein